jgi:GNAT superfamily N-acetyltransferase
MSTVVGLRRELGAWLAARGHDQWVEDYPDTTTMLRGFRADLDAGTTWFALDDDDVAVASVTINRSTAPGLWTPDEQASALFVHRLTVSRAAAGRGVGAWLLDFAGEAASAACLPWVRLDAWTTNMRLHDYYRSQGFELVRIVADHPTPSAACFQRMAPSQLLPHRLYPDRRDTAGSGCDCREEVSAR